MHSNTAGFQGPEPSQAGLLRLLPAPRAKQDHPNGTAPSLPHAHGISLVRAMGPGTCFLFRRAVRPRACAGHSVIQRRMPGGCAPTSGKTACPGTQLGPTANGKQGSPTWPQRDTIRWWSEPSAHPGSQQKSQF